MSSVLKRLFAFLVLMTVSLHAQSVHWEPGAGTLAFNQQNQLSLVFEQCEPEGELKLPEIPGLSVSSKPSISRQLVTNVVNFRTSTSKIVTYAFRVRPTERLDVTIPEFKIKTNQGVVTAPSVRFSIGDATVGNTDTLLNELAAAKIVAPDKPLWQGEVFDLRYNLIIKRGRPFRSSNELNWDKDPFVVDSWSDPAETKTSNGIQAESIVTQSTRALSTKSGTFKLGPIEQEVVIATSQDVFGRATGENFTITAPAVSLTVNPLPVPAPAGFTGAVGKFTLNSQVVPASASVGEPITWTLTLDGIGNWPDIAGLPARSAPRDFTPITPQAKRTNKDGSLFDASITEDVVLIPKKPGTYTLPPVVFTVFNPATGAYENLSTKPVTINVSAGATTAISSASSPGGSAASDLQLKLPSSTDSAATPATLPLDPLASSGSASVPVSSRTLILSLLASIVVPLSVWITLALRRARQTDPARILREAQARLAATLRQLAADSQPSTLNSQLLQAWQRDAAILWNLPQAVPTPAHLADPVWSALWSEADRFLYGNAPLPADWTARASAALSACRVPPFSAFLLFLPRNLLPLVVVTTSLMLASSSLAADGRDAYAKADYPAAEKAWRDTLATDSTNWTAHHNLALALIQQNRPGEAAGHALAAFVQQPQNLSVRWHLAYAWKTAGVTSPPVTQLSTPNSQLAALASPARWQAALIVSAWLSAAAIALGIHAAYRRSPRKLLAGTLLVVSLLLAIASSVSLRTYGPLADARAVVVVTATTLRSIPTDLDTQKSAPLSLGAVAAADKTFLGWTRLRFENGQTGWVRTETLVSLW